MTVQQEIDDLKRKLAARRNRGGYAQNISEIEARIAELEAQNAG